MRAAFRDRNLQPDARPDAVAIHDELTRTPSVYQWVQIVDTPEEFYLVIGTPLNLSHKLGEPMLGKVTLQNISSFNITVGPDGVISPDLFFDDWIGMNAQRQFPRAAYERIANVLVLPAGAISSQIVRLDQGDITAALREKPSSDATMYARVTTNPIRVTNPIMLGTEFVPGPAGLRRDFQKPFIRKNSAMTSKAQEQRVMAGLDDKPSVRMLTLDALQAHVLAARAIDVGGTDRSNDEEQRKRIGRALDLAGRLTVEIDKERGDPVPDVAAWATYLAMQLAKPEEKPQMAAALASSHDPEVRLLAGIAAMDLPAKDRQSIAERLAHDTLPTIALFGTATLQDLAQPTSRPSIPPVVRSRTGTESSPATAPSAPAPATQP